MPSSEVPQSLRRRPSALARCASAAMLQRHRLPLATAATLALLASGRAGSAQTVNAILRGTVTDATGSVLASAHVQLLEPATGQVVREADSQSSGDYEFDEIKPGSYKVRVTAPGFRAYEANMVVLDSGQVRRVDAVLATGEVSDTVTVTEGAAVINTESATISDLYTSRMHDESPQVQIYPSTYSMLTTFSGVQGGTGSYPVVNGQQQSQQSQTFDGIPNDLEGQQSNNANFFEQVAASLVNAPAESPVPALVSQVTKRGANTFHGKATYRIYDSVFDAASYFNPEKTPYLQHEWDLEASGPIWKDRTFFYGGWFAQRIPLGYTYQAVVPTSLIRSGVFSTTVIDPSTGRPFPNNTIPQNRISPVSQAILNNYYPLPNFDGGSSGLNYSTHFPFNSDLYRGDWPIVRVDHNLTKTNSLYGRWLMRQTPYVLNNGLPSLIWTRFRRHQQYAAGDTQLFGSKIVNNLRFGYSTDYIADGQTEAGQTPQNGADVLSTIGLQGANPGNTSGQGFPTITIGGGYTTLSNVPGGVKDNNHILNINDVVDWQLGQHVLRFGGGVQHFSNFQSQVPNYGSFDFSTGFFTGNTFADFLLGLPSSVSRQAPLAARELTLTEWNWFAEDSYKITSRLALNYGLRWDLYGTPSASDHLMYNFNPATGGITVDPQAVSKISPFFPANIPVTAGAVTAVADKTNFAPRVGVAYQLGGHQVLRGGYGLYTARFNDGGGVANFGQGEYFNNFLPLNPQLGQAGPFSQSETYNNTDPTARRSFPNPFPTSTAEGSNAFTAPSQSLYSYPRQVRHGHIHQFNATYENEIAHIGMRASYVGSRSTGIDYLLNVNKPAPGTAPFNSANLPYPQFQALTELRFDGGAHYDALQVEAKRRIGGVVFDASYALSRSQANYLNVENPNNVLSHWANDGVTRRHYATASLFWALPFGKDHAMFAGVGPGVQRLVGGWSVSAITYLASGLFFSPSYEGDASNTGTFNGLPDRVGDPNNVPGGRSKTNWFNQAAFAVPQPGTFGNALPNSLESQNLYQTQVSLTKTFNITERVRFTFNSQISNLFNHPQFLAPSGDITPNSLGNQFQSQFGTFDSLETGQQRQITFLGGFSF